MAGFIGEDQVRRIKEANDLVDVMGVYTTVRSAGRDFKAVCPFHQERTPSCHIYADQQTYHCFSCGAHGDVISLVREKENLEFVDAVEWLARRVGMEVTYERGGQRRDRSEVERHTALMEFATQFYEHCLWQGQDAAAARDYLAGRGLTEEICKAFRLGWAPGHGALVQQARRNGYEAADLIALDLALERNGRLADRFFERITFPIADRFGHPIAFSCRLLPEAERRAKEAGRGVGKYINSRDTPLYHKSNVVFNLHRARQHARTAGRLIVMEGPTDVMAASRAGVEECVAVLGTALTSEHAKQLQRVVGHDGRLILLFDGDAAGQRNSVKAIGTCLRGGVCTHVAIVPDGHDPADLLASEGADGLQRVLDAARSDIQHLLRALAPRPFALDHRERLRIVDDMLAALRGLEDIELRQLYLRDIALHLDIDESQLERRLGAQALPDSPEQHPDAILQHPEHGAAVTPAPEPVRLPPLDREQELVAHILVRCPELREQAFEEWQCAALWFPRPYRDIIDRLAAEVDSELDTLLASRLAQQVAPLRDRLIRWAQSDEGLDGVAWGDASSALCEAIQVLHVRYCDRRISELQQELQDIQRRGEHAAAGDVFQRLLAVQQERRELMTG